MSATGAVATPHRITLSRPGLATPLLVQRADPDTRPSIHPLLAPDGVGVVTEDAPAHHPWQHGLYTGLNGVNGTGFWLEGLREASRATDGTFHPHPLDPPEPDGTPSGGGTLWRVVCDWRAPDGTALLQETQAWRFTDAGDHLALDLEWTLRAVTDLAFDRYAYGGLFLRMPYRPDRGGVALNSDHQQGFGAAGSGPAGADGQRARWVAVAMPLEGRPPARPQAGVAILDHPTNPQHPVPWRVDNQLGIGPSPCAAGAWSLPAGERSVERYRLLVFAGPPEASWIEGQWQRFGAP